ncbi:hypothetical protein BGX29_009936 [Mortierella sp. GBA35]|nr:hypothetical protein BGX29_009936 [Mortierella sp. GBA35]
MMTVARRSIMQHATSSPSSIFRKLSNNRTGAQPSTLSQSRPLTTNTPQPPTAPATVATTSQDKVAVIADSVEKGSKDSRKPSGDLAFTFVSAPKPNASAVTGPTPVITETAAASSSSRVFARSVLDLSNTSEPKVQIQRKAIPSTPAHAIVSTSTNTNITHRIYPNKAHQPPSVITKPMENSSATENRTPAATTDVDMSDAGADDSGGTKTAALVFDIRAALRMCWGVPRIPKAPLTVPISPVFSQPRVRNAVAASGLTKEDTKSAAATRLKEMVKAGIVKKLDKGPVSSSSSSMNTAKTAVVTQPAWRIVSARNRANARQDDKDLGGIGTGARRIAAVGNKSFTSKPLGSSALTWISPLVVPSVDQTRAVVVGTDSDVHAESSSTSTYQTRIATALATDSVTQGASKLRRPATTTKPVPFHFATTELQRRRMLYQPTADSSLASAAVTDSFKQSAWPLLEELDVGVFPGTDKEIANAIRLLPPLKCLRRGYHSDAFGPVCFGNLRERHFDSLRGLDVLSCRLFTSRMALDVLLQWPQLEEFGASCIFLIDILATPQPWVCHGLKKLSTFFASDPDNFASDLLVFEHLSRLSFLEEVDIWTSTLMSSIGVSGPTPRWRLDSGL